MSAQIRDIFGNYFWSILSPMRTLESAARGTQHVLSRCYN